MPSGLVLLFAALIPKRLPIHYLMHRGVPPAQLHLLVPTYFAWKDLVSSGLVPPPALEGQLH